VYEFANMISDTVICSGQKMEHSWRKTKLEAFRNAWSERTLSYRKALKMARSDYFLPLLEEKHNHRYLFNTVDQLTKTFPNSTAVLT